MKHHVRIFLGIMLVIAAGVGSLHAQISANDLLLWLNADAGVTVDGSGSNVVRWADQSVFANDATQTSGVPANQPTLVANALNGHSVLRFDSGATDYLSLTNNSIDLTSGLSIFIVARNAVRKDYNGLFRIGPAGTPFSGNSDLEMYWQLGTTDAGSGNAVYTVNRTTYPANWGNLNLFDAAPAVSKNYLIDVIAGGGNSAMRVNGAGTSLGANYLPTVANWASIGVGYGGSANSINGDIAEIIIYDTNLSATQRDNVWAYLESKYAMGIPEPSTMALLGLGGILLAGRRRK